MPLKFASNTYFLSSNRVFGSAVSRISFGKSEVVGSVFIVIDQLTISPKEYFNFQNKGSLVRAFKHMVLVFKQHYTYFQIFFHSHVFSKKIENYCLNPCTKQKFLKKKIKIYQNYYWGGGFVPSPQAVCLLWVAVFETCSDHMSLLPRRARRYHYNTLLPSAKAYKA